MSLILTIGLPGAGKSTWAEANLDSSFCRLERDRFRECIFGSRRAYHEHGFDRSDRSRVVTQAMLSAMIYWPSPSWALTDTCLDWPAVAPFVDHARRTGAGIGLAIFERPLDLLLERNETREEAHRVPVDLLEERYEAFTNPDAWWRSSAYLNKVYV